MLYARVPGGDFERTSESEFDEIVRLAADSCGAPIAFLRVADPERPWLKSSTGLSGHPEPERFLSFHPSPLEPGGLCLIEDAQADARFRAHPLVQGEPPLRFYAGASLRNKDGSAAGTLCVIDHLPRRLTALQLRTLEHLRRQLETQLRLHVELRQAEAHTRELEETQARLYALNENLQTEMRQRQRFERELLSQRELLTQVLAHIPHAVFWKNRDGFFLGCNDAFAIQFGRGTPRDIVGQTDQYLGFPPALIKAYRRDDQQVIDSGQPKLGIEEPTRGPLGEERWLLTSKVPLRDPDGNIRSVLGIFADITERKQQEATLQQALKQVELHAARLESQVREARERVLRLMDASRDAVFVLNEAGEVLEINAVAERLLGHPTSRLIGTRFDSLAPEQERSALRQALGELLTRGTIRLEDQGLCTAQGERVPVQLVGSLQQAGDTRCQLIVAEDLTEKRWMEQQSIQNDRLTAMGVLAAGIAHEINNPIAYMLANLEVLRQWRNDLEQKLQALPDLSPRLEGRVTEARALIDDCLDGCMRIGDIVRGMRLLSHTGYGETPVPVDVHKSLEAVLHIAQGELKHTARLERDFAPELPMVLGSEGRLGQVFLNLIINAAHAMKAGSSPQNFLRIRSRLDEGRVRVDISDTGHGIPPEVLPRIFDPFFTTKPAGVGTGLGLSISHSIIQEMGGEMRVESRVGQGTTFSLLLPAYAGLEA